MSEPKHGPELRASPQDARVLEDVSTGLVVADVRTHIGEQDARRLAACWNACAGIPTEALEAGKLEAALEALVEVDRADNSCDEYRPQCPWCGASGRGGYMSSDEEEPHAPGCKRTAALRALGRLP